MTGGAFQWTDWLTTANEPEASPSCLGIIDWNGRESTHRVEIALGRPLEGRWIQTVRAAAPVRGSAEPNRPASQSDLAAAAAGPANPEPVPEPDPAIDCPPARPGDPRVQPTAPAPPSGHEELLPVLGDDGRVARALARAGDVATSPELQQLLQTCRDKFTKLREFDPESFRPNWPEEHRRRVDDRDRLADHLAWPVYNDGPRRERAIFRWLVHQQLSHDCHPQPDDARFTDYYTSRVLWDQRLGDLVPEAVRRRAARQAYLADEDPDAVADYRYAVTAPKPTGSIRTGYPGIDRLTGGLRA